MEFKKKCYVLTKHSKIIHVTKAEQIRKTEEKA